MLYFVIGLFAIAAVVGIILLRNLIMPRKPPRAAVYIHGLLAAIALVLLIYYVIKHGNQ